MVFKINISTKEGKTFKLEAEAQGLVGKELHDKISGNDVSQDLRGYEFEISGASDKAGFPSLEQIEGTGLGRVLLSYEKGMKKRPKREGKWKRSDNKPKGLRLRKTARGKVISEEIVQINLIVLKEGDKKLSEIFPEQNKVAEESPKEESKEEGKVEVKSEGGKEPVKEAKSEEKPVEENVEEEKVEAKSEEKKNAANADINKSDNKKTTDSQKDTENSEESKVQENSEPQGEANAPKEEEKKE